MERMRDQRFSTLQLKLCECEGEFLHFPNYNGTNNRYFLDRLVYVAIRISFLLKSGP